jgi:hypothetical protein
MFRRLFRRLYRVRPLPALFLSLPGLLLLNWYAWLSFAKLHRYKELSGETTRLTAETYQIALHDTVTTDWRRVFMPPPPEDSKLQTFRLILDRNEWGELMDSASIRDNRPYVRGKVEDSKSNSLPTEARIRLRGGRHWHLGETQKSFKIKMDKGDLLVGSRVGNLLNDPTPMVVGEQLILDIAKSSGILTPNAHFARVKVNTKDLGVYHYEAGADESMLRAAKRIPGSIYSGELPNKAETPALWAGHELWTKVSSRTDDEADKLDFTELNGFLKHFREDDTAAFAEFAERDLDLEKFALMDVLDVAFGGDQHDFRENHKYYLDPYRGRWEPIAWNFRGFQSDKHFNIVDNPILLRLKFLPSYLTLRNRLLYEFLTTEGSPSQVHSRASKLLKDLAPELKSDAYFDAYHQLPRFDTFHRRMVRPMTLKRLSLVAESELVTYTQRHAQLLGELEKNPLYVQIDAPTPAGQSPGSQPPLPNGKTSLVTPIKVIIDGETGANLRRVTFEPSSDSNEDCFASAPTLQRRIANGELSVVPTLGTKGELELLQDLGLPPAVRIVAHERPNPRRGDIRALAAPAAYEFLLITQCRPANIVFEARHAATGARILARPVTDSIIARLPRSHAPVSAVPRFAVGDVSPHAWSLTTASEREVVLGPGDVDVPATRVFGERERVVVEQGTNLRMGANASLIFLGNVKFKGTTDAPIVVSAAGKEPWGGIAIQGAFTAGSRLRHVVVKGGTEPKFRSVSYPAMVNLHATSDIDLENCHFGAHPAVTDAFHAAYVQNLRMADTEIRQVGGDAIDLEFSQAKLKRLRVVDAGDDGLDLMGSEVDISDSMLIGLKGNGVSAGEETNVTVRNSIVADSKIGVQAKNASRITLSGSLLLSMDIGVRTYQKTVRYAGDSKVSANVLYVVDARKYAVKRQDRDDELGEGRLDEGRVLQALPRRGDLEHVLENVIRLDSWDELPTWVSRIQKEAVSWL